MTYQEIVVRTKDWSINLEEPYYAEHPDALLQAALEAVNSTSPGCYVNLVTPEELGHPEDSFNGRLKSALATQDISVKEIRYIDECGCGGHVTRVYR